MSHKKKQVFVGQTELTIQFECKADLTGATQLWIQYVKPDGTTGHWTGTIALDSSVLEWSPSSVNDLNVAGDYKFWSDVVFLSGRVAVGECTFLTVYEPGSCE